MAVQNLEIPRPRGPDNEAVRECNKAAVRRILEAFNTGDTTIIDQLTHPELIDLTPPPGTPSGLEGLKHQIGKLREQFPDVHLEEEVLVAEGDTVFMRWKMTGTNLGRIYGRPPTGRRITHYGHEIITLKDGMIIKHFDTSDVMMFLDKLGLLDDQMMQALTRYGVRNYE